MISVVAISTVHFRMNCSRTKLKVSEGQLIVDALRERNEPVINSELNIIAQGDGWITLQHNTTQHNTTQHHAKEAEEHQMTFSESDQTLEDQLCATVSSAWQGGENWPDKYQNALDEMQDNNAARALDELESTANFEETFIYLSSIRRRSRLYPPSSIA